MSASKGQPRKTERVVRTPASKLPHLQKQKAKAKLATKVGRRLPKKK